MLSIPFFLFGCITLAVIVGWRFEGLATDAWRDLINQHEGD